MKILRTDKEYQALVEQKEKALEGCDVCPCCGGRNIKHKYYINSENGLAVTTFRCICGAKSWVVFD